MTTIRIAHNDAPDAFETTRDAADRGEHTPPGYKAAGVAYYDPEHPGTVCLDVAPPCACGAPDSQCNHGPAVVTIRQESDGGVTTKKVGNACARRIVAAHTGCQCPVLLA